MGKILNRTMNKNKRIAGFKTLIPFSIRDRSLAYRKLPDQFLKLSVLKLDGSSFYFQVERDANVAKLKLAIEEEFSISPKDEGKILWSIVWRHFCLCYEDKRIISDKARIQSYGITDGAQLHFIQHLRIDHVVSRNQIASKHYPFLMAFGKNKRMTMK